MIKEKTTFVTTTNSLYKYYLLLKNNNSFKDERQVSLYFYVYIL